MKLWMQSLLILCVAAAVTRADVSAEKLYADVTPSFVAVQFQFAGETMNRELVGPGIVVSDDGLILCPMAMFNLQFFPDEQLKDFKIIIPSQTKDADEVDAYFVGRDERANVAFVKAKDKRDWKPLKFEAALPKLGEKVYSIGVLPKSAAFKTYMVEGTVGAHLRGETPQVLVFPGVSGIGGAVFNADGKAVGFVSTASNIFLDSDNPERDMRSVTDPPKFYVPASDFLFALSDPPVAGEPQKLPWIGIPAMRGLTKDVAEMFGLQNQPAVEIGEILPDTPAARAGLQQGNIIVKVNGEPLERADEPQELPGILGRQIRKMKVGDKVTLAIKPGPDAPLKDVEITLEELPKRANRAKRFFAEDLGFVAREIVFQDTYRQRMPQDTKGVVVALLKPSGSAETAKLQVGDVITQLNGKTVESLEQFQKDYEAFRKESPKEAVVLVVWRRFPQTESIRIEPPR